VLRRSKSLISLCAVLACVVLLAPAPRAFAQETKTAKKTNPPASTQVTGEGVAETAIYLNGTREGMAQIRRTGVERGRVTRVLADGKSQEVTYERRFLRGENAEKDRIRIENKMPTAEYSLVFSSGEVWGIINDAVFTPRQETTDEFLAMHRHGIDSLLRYKENGSTLNFIGKEKQKGLDLFVLDVTDKSMLRTRFYISAKSARVLWLEYEEKSAAGSDAAKFVRKFHDYRLVQGTLVPYRSELIKDGKQVEETQIMTITFGPRIDEALFRNPNAPSPTTASKP